MIIDDKYLDSSMEKQSGYKLKSLPSTTQSIDLDTARSKSPGKKNNIYEEKASMADVKSLLSLSTRPNKNDYVPLSENRLKWLNVNKVSIRNRTPSPLRNATIRSNR